MALNGNALNSFVLNGNGDSTIIGYGGGVVVTLAQQVGSLAAGAVQVSIEQEILLRSTAVGIVATLIQEVRAQGSKSIEIDQVIVAVDTTTTYHDRNGYEPRLYINNVRVPNEEIHGEIECIYTENDAPQLRFTIIPPNGSIDIRSYRGNSVTYKIREGTTVSTIFHGKVNIPDVQIIDQKITFNCSRDIEQVVETFMGRAQLNKIGLYNNSVFSKPESNLQELRDRLSTIPYVLNIRKTGVPSVDPIAVKATADYTLTNSDVYRTRTEFDYKMGSGQRYINKINLRVNYGYQRLHHHERSFVAGVGHTSVCEMLIGGYDILSRALVGGAVQGSQWPLKGGISYGEMYPSGVYNCFVGSAITPILWSTVSYTSTNQAVVDSDGNPVLKDGKQQYKKVSGSATQLSQTICLGAQWTATTRFGQNIKSEYTLTVQAPQSIAQNGVKERDLNYSLNSSFDSGEWEKYNSYTTRIPSGVSISGTSNTNYWINADTNKSLFNSSVNIMLNKAKSDILKSHREDKIVIKRSLWTAVDLWQTIEIDTDKLEAKGRVHNFRHVVDVNTGEAYTIVELIMSQSTGSASDSNLTIPGILTSTPSYPTLRINLGSGHYGQDPSGAGAEKWTGHIANKYLTYPTITRTSYPESFVVDVPPIPNNLRSESTLTSAASYEVEIPNDALTINFNE